MTVTDTTASTNSAWATPSRAGGESSVPVPSALLDHENARTPGYQRRLILNWERDLISVPPHQGDVR